jgi:hypothetical protein
MFSGRRERTIKPQFTLVNEDFEDDRNEVMGLSRQTLIRGITAGRKSTFGRQA